MHITQPAVTQHIRALEKEYEVKLFKKEGRCLVPTEKAMEFYRMAKQLTTMEKHIHLSMQKQPAIPLYYGATKSIAETILPSLTFYYAARISRKKNLNFLYKIQKVTGGTGRRKSSFCAY